MGNLMLEVEPAGRRVHGHVAVVVDDVVRTMFKTSV